MARLLVFSTVVMVGLAVVSCGDEVGADIAGQGDLQLDLMGELPIHLDIVQDVSDVSSDMPAADADDAQGDSVLADSDRVDVDASDALPVDVAWAGSVQFPLDGVFYAAHPKAFARISRYATHVSGPVAQRPNKGHRGSFGAGNGKVFAFSGLADPLNTLHSLVGPTYERRPNFFGDYRVQLAGIQDSAPPDFEEEWIGRSLSAPVVVTRGRLGELELDTIDVSPTSAVVLPDTCLFRILLVRNRATTVSRPVTLVVAANNEVFAVQPQVLVENGVESDGMVRTLATLFVGAVGQDAVAQGKTLSLYVGEIQPGGELLRVLAHCTGETPATGPVGMSPINPVSSDELWQVADPEGAIAEALDAAAFAYGAWEAGTVQADLPDPMVADFLDGMKMTLKVQTAVTGATCPMSQYTRTWARDNIGPVMALLAFGAFEDVDRMLDYVYGAIRYAGDLKNSYDADLDVTGAPPAPDWELMSPLSGRVAAETPSYLVTMYGLHHRYSGDLARVAERWDLLRRCLFDQGFGPDRLLPFTGDETYRAAMNAAFGMELEYPHQDMTWSANSTFLWLGAARAFERMAEELGRTGEGDEARALAAEVEASSVPRFVLEDGCVAAFVSKDTLAASMPFEDVALQVTWSGWKDGDDPFAAASLDCLVQRLGRAPGEIVSRPDPSFGGVFDSWEGVYTGMLPGYALAGLTDASHPQAGDAFAAVRKSLDTSGNLQEYMLFDDHSGLSAFYDPEGTVGDYTAKFRPWEGGIVSEAAMRYLAGFSPDAAARRILLRPHLPVGWPRMAFRGLRAGGERFDLTVQRIEADRVEVKIARQAGGAVGEMWEVDLRWDASSGQPGIDVDGLPLPESDIARTASRFGTVSATTPAAELSVGGSVAFAVH